MFEKTKKFCDSFLELGLFDNNEFENIEKDLKELYDYNLTY